MLFWVRTSVEVSNIGHKGLEFYGRALADGNEVGEHMPPQPFRAWWSGLHKLAVSSHIILSR